MPETFQLVVCHLNEKLLPQGKHLRDKLVKLLVMGFVPGIGPALLTDLMLLFEILGIESGISGAVLDVSNSSQNNKRCQEIASIKVSRHLLFLYHLRDVVVHSAGSRTVDVYETWHIQVCLALLQHLPGALGTAVHVLISAAHLAAFCDDPDKAPFSPMTRLALCAFAHTFLVFQTVAMSHGPKTNPPMTDFKYSLQGHSYTAPTRHAICNALPGLAACLHVQHRACESGDKDAYPFVPGCCGSQECESFFGEIRSSGSLQNTGAVSCGSAVRHIPKVMMTNKAEADGLITTLKSKHAGRHTLHDLSHYKCTTSDWDITCSIHTGVQMAYELLDVLGYGPLLLKFPTLSKVMPTYLEIIAPVSPAVRRLSTTDNVFTTLCPGFV